MIPITHSALVALAGSSNLVPGAFYEITDYRTVHYIQYSGPVTGSGGIGGEEVFTGPIEPLIVQAVSFSEISSTASSTLYPNDVIYYLLSVPDYEYDYVAATGKGCIIYREDTVRRIARDYDWRNVVFRRWETSPGSGDYYSPLPVIGAAYQDVEAQDPDICNDVYIKSPLSNSLQFDIISTGFPYWLDNTVLDAGQVKEFSSSFAYLNHITGYTSSIVAVSNEFFILYNNLIAVNDMSKNSYVTVTNNQIVEAFVNTAWSGTFPAFGNNSGASLENNVVSGIIHANRTYYVTNNNVTAMLGNDSLYIEDNNTSFIVENKCSGISNNIADNISNNIANFIRTNDCSGIENNMSVIIENNIITTSIAYNNVYYIRGNTCSEISENLGNRIETNNISFSITGNNCNFIGDNGNGGTISNNTGYYIWNNTNTDEISDNVCSVISGNTNNGNITENTGQAITNNSTDSFISTNKVQYIKSNTTTGTIASNVGYSIDSNLGDVNISLNNVYTISGNGSSSIINVSRNQGFKINSNTFDSNFSSNTFRDFEGNAFGNSAGANAIVNHNFIDSITSSTITPTTEMSDLNKPTKSMLDANDGFHYEVTLSSGAFSFVAIT
jgi:hypothetical protein